MRPRKLLTRLSGLEEFARPKSAGPRGVPVRAFSPDEQLEGWRSLVRWALAARRHGGYEAVVKRLAAEQQRREEQWPTHVPPAAILDFEPAFNAARLLGWGRLHGRIGTALKAVCAFVDDALEVGALPAEVEGWSFGETFIRAWDEAHEEGQA